ncbi:YceI family protein [Elizabethkingia meningoseptica]|uniref:YceI family protein n=1 Tax=Elizabethkingia meningoseptica TaxID=238 RepID=UPI0023B09975|nr:YceI family protein [Elizabethkingia meningoseptica]MDE5439164.1 YceI family protein [Elizabethkingia meningoseptica]MDE5509277.1 YceI family protein [Elizabethkingia meningoseptica]MDE5516708.1 YceI family protein [Elizabethkingia meningoseptica]MDE5527505.1 YceI family protein [Elizabethkingia meningoseptica]MDE5530947.1 YceI family protein [Elizabethkingia meningoseptica]
MKKLFSFLSLLLASAFIFAQTAWKADPAHSHVAFTVVHTGISDVSGIFNTFDLAIASQGKDFSDAKVNFSIDVNSINTNVEARDNHLKSPDFFDAAQFDKITFNSTSLKVVKPNTYSLKGNLTLHGVTKPVTMTMVYRGEITDKKSGKVTKGIQVYGDVKRSDFGIGSKFPDAMISDVVRIKADFEVKQ